jgi:hypothetical protein
MERKQKVAHVTKDQSNDDEYEEIIVFKQKMTIM